MSLTLTEVVATLKAGRDFDDPWVVFHADSNAELADLLGAAEATGLLALVAKASGDLKGHYVAGKGLGARPVQAPAAAEAHYYAGPPQDQGYQQQAPPPQQTYQQPPPQQYQQAPAQGGQQPPGPAPTCMHGPKVYKPAGQNAKSGKTYGASWACQLKDSNWRDPNGCPPQWINER